MVVALYAQLLWCMCFNKKFRSCVMVVYILYIVAVIVALLKHKYVKILLLIWWFFRVFVVIFPQNQLVWHLTRHKSCLPLVAMMGGCSCILITWKCNCRYVSTIISCRLVVLLLFHNFEDILIIVSVLWKIPNWINLLIVMLLRIEQWSWCHLQWARYKESIKLKCHLTKKMYVLWQLFLL